MRICRVTTLFLLITVAVASIVLAGDDVPQRVILNLTAAPATSMAVTWRTLEHHERPAVEYAVATPGPLFEKSASTVDAVATGLPGKNGVVYSQCSAVLTGLLPKTTYIYRVGHDSVWSEWNQFTTAGASAEPFSFVFLGDPQDDLLEHVSRSFRETFRHAPEARFWAFSGDLTSDPEEKLWEQWFAAAGFIPRMVPMIMVPGNHDHGSIKLANGKKQRTKELPLWRPQFTLPENGVAGLEEASYVIDYQGVRFLMLDGNDKLKEQAVWVDSVLANNPNRWTVAVFHQPFYSSGRNRDERETRNAFQEVFERRGVDLVLQGHDHTYARSKKLSGGVPVPPDARGIVYVVSSCGPKNYVLQPLYKDLMEKMGENLQLFQVVSVDGSSLKYRAVTMDGMMYDSFELHKN